jgi:hypothetical protein
MSFNNRVVEVLPDGTNDGASPRRGRIVDVDMVGELVQELWFDLVTTEYQP